MKSKTQNPKLQNRTVRQSISALFCVVFLFGIWNFGFADATPPEMLFAHSIERGPSHRINCCCNHQFVGSRAPEKKVTGAEFPPQKPAIMPEFTIPEIGSRSLDDVWNYVATLIDADTADPTLWNAFPVGMVFSKQGHGMIATLHTAFISTNGGNTWRNLDPSPPPFFSTFNALRSPSYITSLALRQGWRNSTDADSFYITVVDVDADTSGVRLFGYLFNEYRLNPIVQFTGEDWFSHIVVHDSARASILAGLEDGHIYHTDSIYRYNDWDTLSYEFTNSYLAGDIAKVGGFAIAVGSNQWITRDYGFTWETQTAADALGDFGASFYDTEHGFVGGGRTNPPSGWARVTNDGAVTWSIRTLNAQYPIRAVLRIDSLTGYAAGGDYNTGVGGVWRTSDGGFNWTEELSVDAEIRHLAMHRVNSSYLDIFAAGSFPDFRGGVWRSRLFRPDSSRSVILFAYPDSLHFGPVAGDPPDTLTTYLYNIGTDTARFLSSFSESGFFHSPDIGGVTLLAPGDSMTLRVVCTILDNESRSDIFQIVVLGDQNLPIPCSVEQANSAGRHDGTAIPEMLRLEIFPNPANAAFNLKFYLPVSGAAQLAIFDLMGRRVDSQDFTVLPAGEHAHSYDASALSSGIYFVTLSTNHAVTTAKMLLLK